jgi:hypothetical protein
MCLYNQNDLIKWLMNSQLDTDMITIYKHDYSFVVILHFKQIIIYWLMLKYIILYLA